MLQFPYRFQRPEQCRFSRDRQRSVATEGSDEPEHDAASVRGHGEQRRGGAEGSPDRRAIGDPSATGSRHDQTLLDHNQSSPTVQRTVSERKHGRRRAERGAVRSAKRAVADESSQFPARRLPRHRRSDAVHRDAADP